MVIYFMEHAGIDCFIVGFRGTATGCMQHKKTLYKYQLDKK